MSQPVVTVTALVRYLKGRLENDANIQGVLVEGEISNFSSYRSGHWYFSLKDTGAQMRCVMFASNNRSVKFTPKDGDKVTIRADVSVFESRGDLQLLVTAMRPTGIGDLYQQFELLKKKLSKEGLFDESHHKPIPKYPFRIGLVTGRNTAARADVLNTVSRRWPAAEIVEFPVNVQGKESAAQIINALIEADAKKLDVILLVRGGGSIEDLWSFNDERLARTIYALNTPLISGIGHEVDFTIADFVADLRAPTPTGAAERATPNRQEVSALLQTDRIRLINYVSGAIKESRDRLQKDSERSVFTNTQRLYSERQLKLDALFLQLKRSLNEQSQTLSQRLQDDRHTLLLQAQSEIDKEQIKIERCSNRLKTHIQLCISDSRNQLNHDISVLDAYSPLKVMKRGYSAVTLENKTINSAGDLKEGDRVHIRFSQGSADAAVIKVRKGE